MRKSAIVKLFIGSLLGLGAALVLFLVAGGLALANGVLVMDGPDVVGLQPSALGGTMIALAAIAVLAMAAAGIVQFVAWVAAVFSTAQFQDKTWFVVLLVLGLVSLGFPAMIAYVIAGPDGTAPPTPQAVRDTASASVPSASVPR